MSDIYADIYDYYNKNPILTDQPPNVFPHNKKSTFIKLKYEEYDGSKVPIDTSILKITQKGEKKYLYASVQYSALIYKCIKETIENVEKNSKDTILKTYPKDGCVRISTIGSDIRFKNRNGVENFKKNMFNLFDMVKQKSDTTYRNYFLNNVLSIVHNNRNSIMDYLFSLQHDLGSFYDILIKLMIPYSNSSGSATKKKSISFLASNNDVINDNVLQKIVKKEMEAVRNNVTLINTHIFSKKTQFNTWESYKQNEKIYFDLIDKLTMKDGNTSAIKIVNTMFCRYPCEEKKLPRMNKFKVTPKLLINKVKETACVVVGFHYLIENNIVTGDLKNDLIKFLNPPIEEKEEESDENYNVNQENLNNEIENVNNEIEKIITNEDIEDLENQGLIGDLSEEQPEESLTLLSSSENEEKDDYGSEELLPTEGLDLNPPEETQDPRVQELKRHMNTYKIPHVSDLTVRPTMNPTIKSINLKSDNGHILCKIIFEKGDFTYTTIVDNFKRNTKYVSILKEAWWRKTNEISVINQTNTWKYKGYGKRPQVECYSRQKFWLPGGSDFGVSYIYNDHKIDVLNKKCLYLDLVYPDKERQCKAFVTPILLSHRYYLTNIHNLDVDKGVVWLGSTSGMGAFYCYKNAFENAGFKFNGEYKTSLYNGITFPIAYVKDNTTYYKLQTDDSTDRIFLTKDQADAIIDSEESKMIAFIRGAEVKAECTPTTNDKSKQTLIFRAKFANKMLDIMEKTNVTLFNTFMDEFKTKDGIKIDKNRVETGIKPCHINNAINDIVNDYLVKIKRSIVNPTDIPDTNTTQWVWNEEGARTDIFTLNNFDKIEEWMYKDWDGDNGAKKTYKQKGMTPKEKAIFKIKNTNKIFERMYNDNKEFFKIFKDMFNNAYFTSYKINDENKLCNNKFKPMTGKEAGRGAFTQEKIESQYNYLSRSKRNFPLKYSVHMVFEKTNNDYNMLYLG